MRDWRVTLTNIVGTRLADVRVKAPNEFVAQKAARPRFGFMVNDRDVIRTKEIKT